MVDSIGEHLPNGSVTGEVARFQDGIAEREVNLAAAAKKPLYEGIAGAVQQLEKFAAKVSMETDKAIYSGTLNNNVRYNDPSQVGININYTA